MEKIINNVNKGVLVKGENKNRKPSEAKLYYSFWFEADNSLEYLFNFPHAAYYMFTKNEFDRFIRRQASIANRNLFQVGVLNTFLMPNPTVIVKLDYEGSDNVVRLPLALLRRAVNRGAKNPEDRRRPGLLNIVASVVTEALRK